MATRRKRLRPIHPGEILLEEFLKPFGISINRIARDIDVPPGRVSLIVNGKRGITADTALRLAKYFRVSAELWMGLQSEYDLRVAQRKVADEIEKRVRPHVA
jgi:addiction module HigA family antidote